MRCAPAEPVPGHGRRDSGKIRRGSSNRHEKETTNLPSFARVPCLSKALRDCSYWLAIGMPDAAQVANVAFGSLAQKTALLIKPGNTDDCHNLSAPVSDQQTSCAWKCSFNRHPALCRRAKAEDSFAAGFGRPCRTTRESVVNGADG
jgi:hypothetical protein